VKITAYDHVGLRVTDRARSMAFYEALGFRLDEEHSSATALEIVNESGVRMNLILNGEPTALRDNVLMDRPEKWPGYTHTAFIVERLSETLDWAAKKNVTITEGPIDWGRRITCFLRDPDSNVLEFNELKPADSGHQVDACTLVLGQKNYSSWSMRAWLLLKTLDVPFTEVTIPLYRTESREAVRALGGQTGLVPVLIDGGTAIWDTLAIFEHLHESYPCVWPADRYERARARSLSGEIHSSFNGLRAAMPVNTRARGRHAKRTTEVTADIERAVQIWEGYQGGTPWLFGSFSGADIMFAPIATRFQTYGVQLAGAAKTYMDRLLDHPLVAEWLRLGQQEVDVIEVLELGVLGGAGPSGTQAL
jgi:glutathione S-transferase